MRYVLTIGLLLAASSAAVAQEAAPQEDAGAQAEFLVSALMHRDGAIRTTAAQTMDRDARVPGPLGKAILNELAATVQGGNSLHATRSAIVLIHLGEAAGPVVPHLAHVLKQPSCEGWRWYLSAFAIDKIDPAARDSLLQAVIGGLRSRDSMKQYAAVQWLYAMGEDAKAATDALLALLDHPRCFFTGVYLNDRVIGDYDMAYTDEIGIYTPQFQLLRDDLYKSSQVVFPIDGLLILETARRIGAPPERIVPHLIRISYLHSDAVQFAAAKQLVQFGPQAQQAAVRVLNHLMNDKYSFYYGLMADDGQEIRDQAIGVLLELEPKYAAPLVPSLIQLLGSDDDDLRVSAAFVLAEYGSVACEAIPYLNEALHYEKLDPTGAADDMQVALEKLQAACEAAATEQLPPAK